MQGKKPRPQLEIDSEEVSQYIQAILKGVSQGTSGSFSHGFFLGSSVKIRLGIKNVGEKEGGLKLQVVGVGAKRSKEEDAVIEFEVVNLFSAKLKEMGEAALKQFTIAQQTPQTSSTVASQG